MPKFYEVFGHAVSDHSDAAVSARKRAHCPFTQSPCDGGGNRHQTKIKLDGSKLRTLFDPAITHVIPGICAIQSGEDTWVVCPRRLLGFHHAADGLPTTNASLQAHEREALRQAGLPAGVELGVWAEVYLQYGDEDSAINYHFDFVIAPIQRGQPFSWLLSQHGIVDASVIDALQAAAKSGGYLKGKNTDAQALPILPDLTSPTIIEVMTASTSGSDREAGTDIASAFTSAILGEDHNCPGINKRQVWGRMATQLFAKSALAKAWGGQTVWLVQDQLLKNIVLTTKLDLRSSDPSAPETINFLSLAYAPGKTGTHALHFEQYIQKNAGLGFGGNQTATDILLPKATPDKTALLKAVLRRKLSAIIML